MVGSSKEGRKEGLRDNEAHRGMMERGVREKNLKVKLKGRKIADKGLGAGVSRLV